MRYLLLLVSVGCGLAIEAQPEKPLLGYRITGFTNSSAPAENATYAMVHPEVQRLLLDVAASPRDRQYVEAALRPSPIRVEDMVSNGSLRLEGDRYWLNFPLLTRADQETVVRAAEIYSRRLADAYLARRKEIEALLRLYDLDGVDRKAVAFVVLGCFSLDWDGLRYATRNGYRASEPVRKGGRFFVMAEERGGPSLQRMYWGSGSMGYGKYGITTFGDHFSPRSHPLKKVGEPGGAILLALRDGARETADLPATNRDEVLAALVSAGYVHPDGTRYRAAIPVLSMRDQKMIEGLRRLGREALREWFTANYAEFRSAMRDIAPVRNGIPFPVAFDQLWHYLFGIANRKLVEDGLFADPYAPGAPRQGYVPVVYALKLKVQAYQE